MQSAHGLTTLIITHNIENIFEEELQNHTRMTLSQMCQIIAEL